MPVQTESLKEAGSFMQQISNELEQTERTLQEVNMLLEQSQSELNKLTQRNASIAGHLQQVQAQFESMPRADIRSAYNSALEAQQRLLVMRGQLEKFQSDQANLQKYASLLKKLQKAVGEEGIPAANKKKKNSGSAMLEMVIKAQEAERQRLSRIMHDGPAQALSNFIVQTEIAARFFDLDAARAKEELTNLKQAALTTFQKVRTFIFELRPMSLDDLGLFPTVKRYADAFKEQTGVEVVITLKGQEQRFESFIEVLVFRALQELMGNAYRHNLDAPNKIQINLNVVVEDDLIKVNVNDNGKGFDPEEITQSEGIGLKLIRERVEMLGGYMEIDAAIGQGARVLFQVPLPQAAGASQ
jgi:two-component system, NarL family, sensor histidine kinase DegS